MILDDLFAGADDLADLTIRQPLPNQGRHLNFLGCEALAGHHGRTSSLVNPRLNSSLENMAMANFTRLRPSRIPARKNRVRRCCLTVRGLMFNWPAISLLLQPCTSRLSTC